MIKNTINNDYNIIEDNNNFVENKCDKIIGNLKNGCCVLIIIIFIINIIFYYVKK